MMMRILSPIVFALLFTLTTITVSNVFGTTIANTCDQSSGSGNQVLISAVAMENGSSGGNSGITITDTGGNAGNTAITPSNATWDQVIRLDLSEKKAICEIDVTWQSVAGTQHNFIISVSDDAVTYTDVFNAESSSNDVLERYIMPADTNGQYIRIMIDGVNTIDNWASIKNLAVFGDNTISLADFSVGTAGDFANGQNAINTFNGMASHDVDIAIGLGDNAYTLGQSAVNSWYQKIVNSGIDDKWYSALGNHDVSDQSSYDAKFVNQNGFTFSFNHQNVHFLSVNTEESVSVGSQQYNFIENDLHAASDDPNVGWIVVFMHKPMYASCSSHCPDAQIRDALNPLFDQYGVDLVLAGHNHNYQRMYPLQYGSGDNAIITTTNTTDYTDPSGQVYMVVGTGGQGPYGLAAAKPYTVKQFNDSSGFLYILITENGTKLIADYFDNSNTVGKTDHFTIKKTGANPPPPGRDDPNSIGAFFYPWYGKYRHWTDSGHSPPATWASDYLPQLYPGANIDANLYDSNDPATIQKQLTLMNSSGIEFGISSWWGQNSYEDQAFAKIITQPQIEGFKWTILYEQEGFGDPTVQQIVDDLNYIKTNYASDPNYLYKDGKPVIFVYNAAHTGSDPLDDLARWMDAKQQAGFYVVFKVDPLGAGADPALMDSWYQYAPTKHFEQQGTWSAFVSPGFDKYHESPRLERNITAFTDAVQQLKNAQVDWKLVETWNELGEGSGIEPAIPITHDDVNGFRLPIPPGDEFLNSFSHGMKN